MDAEEVRWRQEDEAGSAEGAMQLGSLLKRRGDTAGALEAFARAEGRGHPEAPGMIGVIHEEQGALDIAIPAYRRAVAMGSQLAAFNLGLVLVNQGDELGALEAWSNGDRSGDAECSANLGSLLLRRGDAAAAEAAFVRADQGGSAHGAWRLGEFLEGQERFDEALATYRRGADRGSAEAAFSLAAVLIKLDDMPGAVPALERAQELGHPHAADMLERLRAELQPQTITIGEMLETQAKLADEDPVGQMTFLEARHLFDDVPDVSGETEAGLEAEASSTGATHAYVRLGLLRERAGDLSAAADAFRVAADRGDAYAEFRLGFMAELHQKDESLAIEHYRRADAAGERNAAGTLGRLLKEQEQFLEAEQAFGRCYDRGGSRASADYAGLLMNRPSATEEELRGAVIKLCEVEDLHYQAEVRDRREGGDGHTRRIHGMTGPPMMVFSGMWERVDAATMRAGAVAADAGGSASGAFHLGVALQEAGNLQEAVPVFVRAAERGRASGWTQAGACALQAQNPSAAEAFARRGEEAGEVDSIFLLALARDTQGDIAGSIDANQRADAMGHREAALNLGIDLRKVGRVAEAEQAFLRAQERGSEQAGQLLEELRRAGR